MTVSKKTKKRKYRKKSIKKSIKRKNSKSTINKNKRVKRKNSKRKNSKRFSKLSRKSNVLDPDIRLRLQKGGADQPGAGTGAAKVADAATLGRKIEEKKKTHALLVSMGEEEGAQMLQAEILQLTAALEEAHRRAEEASVEDVEERFQKLRISEAGKTPPSLNFFEGEDPNQWTLIMEGETIATFPKEGGITYELRAVPDINRCESARFPLRIVNNLNYDIDTYFGQKQLKSMGILLPNEVKNLCSGDRFWNFAGAEGEFPISQVEIRKEYITSGVRIKIIIRESNDIELQRQEQEEQELAYVIQAQEVERQAREQAQEALRAEALRAEALRAEAQRAEAERQAREQAKAIEAGAGIEEREIGEPIDFNPRDDLGSLFVLREFEGNPDCGDPYREVKIANNLTVPIEIYLYTGESWSVLMNIEDTSRRLVLNPGFESEWYCGTSTIWGYRAAESTGVISQVEIPLRMKKVKIEIIPPRDEWGHVPRGYSSDLESSGSESSSSSEELGQGAQYSGITPILRSGDTPRSGKNVNFSELREERIFDKSGDDRSLQFKTYKRKKAAKKAARQAQEERRRSGGGSRGATSGRDRRRSGGGSSKSVPKVWRIGESVKVNSEGRGIEQVTIISIIDKDHVGVRFMDGEVLPWPIKGLIALQEERRTQQAIQAVEAVEVAESAGWSFGVPHSVPGVSLTNFLNAPEGITYVVKFFKDTNRCRLEGQFPVRITNNLDGPIRIFYGHEPGAPPLKQSVIIPVGGSHSLCTKDRIWGYGSKDSNTPTSYIMLLEEYTRQGLRITIEIRKTEF